MLFIVTLWIQTCACLCVRVHGLSLLSEGVIVAVLGMEPENDGGKFHVEDYCFQLLPEQIPRPVFTEERYKEANILCICLHDFGIWNFNPTLKVPFKILFKDIKIYFEALRTFFFIRRITYFVLKKIPDQQTLHHV